MKKRIIRRGEPRTKVAIFGKNVQQKITFRRSGAHDTPASSPTYLFGAWIDLQGLLHQDYTTIVRRVGRATEKSSQMIIGIVDNCKDGKPFLKNLSCCNRSNICTLIELPHALFLAVYRTTFRQTVVARRQYRTDRRLLWRRAMERALYI